MYNPSLTFLRIQHAPNVSIIMFNTGVIFIIFLTHKEFSISLMFLYLTLLCGHFMYNSCLFIFSNAWG